VAHIEHAAYYEHMQHFTRLFSAGWVEGLGWCQSDHQLCWTSFYQWSYLPLKFWTSNPPMHIRHCCT